MPSIPAAVVGTRFRGPEALHAISMMKVGDPVRLVREADNPHDPNAVACWYLGVHVGFIPRQANPRIADAMDAGATPTAVVDITPVLRGDRIDREPRILVRWGDIQ